MAQRRGQSGRNRRRGGWTITQGKRIIFNYEELLRLEAALDFRKEYYQKRLQAISDIRDQLDKADELEADTKDELYRYTTLYDKIHYNIQHYEEEDEEQG